jgi:adenylate cyclase
METEKTKRKLIAVVHADVKGYSRLMGEDDEYTVRTLASNRGEMYRLVELHGGEVRDTAGDGFLVEFASVVDAIKFSVDFQREMKRRNAEIPENRKMEFRIGVNIGDVIHDGETIHGDGVNIAARLEGLADPGGICISGAAYEQVKKKLNVGFEFIGDKSVKNIAEPVPTYKVLVEEGEATVRKERPTRAEQSPRRRTYLIAAAVIGIVALASVAIRYVYFHAAPPPNKTALEQAPDLPLPDKPSIAVLPFTNMSGDPKQEYFSDGITEEIITSLSKMPELFVIARNSSFAFKGKPVDIKEVGRKLGVRHLLEGSVRKQGDRVRITVQLIDCQTGGHVWAERYDRELKDIFALQDEITRKVMVELRVKLVIGEQARLWLKRATDNPKALEKFFQAKAYYLRNTKDGNIAARPLLEEVIELDPSWAAGYTALCGVYVVDIAMGWSKNPVESLHKAYEMANKAISLDDSLDSPHYILGLVYTLSGRYDDAIAEGERAIVLNPNGAQALAFLGMFLNYAGRPAEAIPVLHKAMRLNPIPPAFYYSTLGQSYMLTDQYAKAIATLEKGLQIQSDHTFCLLYLSAAYSQAGMLEEAYKTAADFLRFNPKFTLKRFEKVVAYKYPAVKERYIKALREAGLK